MTVVLVTVRDSETDILKGGIQVELAESVGILLQDQRRQMEGELVEISNTWCVRGLCCSNQSRGCCPISWALNAYIQSLGTHNNIKLILISVQREAGPDLATEPHPGLPGISGWQSCPPSGSIHLPGASPSLPSPLLCLFVFMSPSL